MIVALTDLTRASAALLVYGGLSNTKAGRLASMEWPRAGGAVSGAITGRHTRMPGSNFAASESVSLGSSTMVVKVTFCTLMHRGRFPEG